MIRRIEITNFMSHAHSVIDLADGVTALVGPNNCGKSAIVEALICVCQNPRGKYMIRHGEKLCTVTVHTNDGHEITWQRDKNTARYIIDGTPHERLRGGVPDEVHAFLKMSPVELDDGRNIDLHIAEQKSPLFLLQESEATRAKFFAAGRDAALLLRMQQLHEQKTKERTREHKQLANEQEQVARQIKALEPINQTQVLLNRAEAQRQSIEKSDEQTQLLAKLLERQAKLNTSIEQLQTRRRALADLQPPPQLQDEDALQQVIRKLERSSTIANEQRQRLEAMKSLSPPPELADCSPLALMLRRLDSTEADITRARRHRDALSKLPEPPELTDETSLSKLMFELKRATTAVDQQRRQLQAAQDKLQQARHDIEAWTQANPGCPTCGQAIDADQLLEHVHADHGHADHATGGAA